MKKKCVTEEKQTRGSSSAKPVTDTFSLLNTKGLHRELAGKARSRTSGQLETGEQGGSKGPGTPRATATARWLQWGQSSCGSRASSSILRGLLLGEHLVTPKGR